MTEKSFRLAMFVAVPRLMCVSLALSCSDGYESLSLKRSSGYCALVCEQAMFTRT